ncbi:Tar ligand binding domain-containing protein [Enterobacter pasteurii]|uniref:methyl-accepting chemotaxis protein n=1 Tax=Enterobacter pasteurii TaxID=3029761 RepID=UPI0011DE50C7|nr:methyl-accepting chemotaxis protein [Enterobacter pasteurii]QLA68106.1 Tar ligand binding domain-containing protein [Enterobacter pasteurii]
MFREFKIATGLNLLIGMFVAFIIIISTFSLVSSFTTSNNFNKVIVTSDNVDMMNSAVYELNGAMVQVNALMLAKSLNRSVDESDIEKARDRFNQAKERMNKFMATPFETKEEQQKANELKRFFDTVMANAINKMSYISNPASSPDTMDSDFKARTTLSEKVHDYLDTSGELSSSYTDEANHNTRLITIISVIVLALCLAGVILSRLWLKRTIFNRLEQAKGSFQLIASGDLSKEIDAGARNEIGLMLEELERMRVSLTNTVKGIRGSVDLIYDNVREIASSNNDLSSRTEEQASALQQTAASMEELKITVRQNADNAHSAKQLAESASTSARKGGEVMTNLDGIMQEITENSRQIADINSVIDSIANQTNILALNAAVEAARAGEQGRGFAVVAGEVRNLAKRSADAAKEIRQLINTCVANMNIGSTEVEQAGASMTEIVKSVTQVTDIMAEITSASDEQSSGINQIAQAVNEMDLVTQQNAAMVEQAAKVSSNVESHTGELNHMVSKFVLDERKLTKDVYSKRNTENSLSTQSSSSMTTVKRDSGNTKFQEEEQWETF